MIIVLGMSKQEDFKSTWKAAWKTREIDKEARISKKAKMKRKFNGNQKQIALWDIQLSSLTTLYKLYISIFLPSTPQTPNFTSFFNQSREWNSWKSFWGKAEFPQKPEKSHACSQDDIHDRVPFLSNVTNWRTITLLKQTSVMNIF